MSTRIRPSNTINGPKIYVGSMLYRAHPGRNELRIRAADQKTVAEKSTNDRRAIRSSNGIELLVRSFGHCHTAFLTIVRLQLSKSVSLGDCSRKPHRIAAASAAWNAFTVHLRKCDRPARP
jgi:hypothetical protein